MKAICNFTLLIFWVGLIQSQNWEQSGNIIFGAMGADCQGRTVALNDNGTIVAIGSPQSDASGTNSGQVRVYQLINNSWTQMGSAFNGTAAYNYFGDGVKLSKDGKTIVMSSSTEHYLGYNFGSVRVYTWNETNWEQKGSTLYGLQSSGYFGGSIDVSDDGNTIAVLAPLESNKVRIYVWNNALNNWQLKGSAISNGGGTGSAIELSGDGNSVIIGVPGLGSSTAIGNGFARVYFWDGVSWVQRGAEFTGINIENMGRNVNINGDGSIIAVGMPKREPTGQIIIYQWNGSSWNQKGQNLEGIVSVTNNCCNPNFSSSLDSEGNTFAYWCYEASQQGTVRVFTWDGLSWVPKGVAINGGLGDNFMVNFVALNYDGNGLVIGFPYDFYFNDNISSGRTKVYKWNSDLSTPSFNLNEILVYPNPVKDVLSVESNLDIYAIEVFTIDGKKIVQQKSNDGELFFGELPTGIYIMQFKTSRGIVTKKISKI